MKIDKTLRGYQWKELYSDFKIVSKFFDIRDINTIFIYNKDVNIAGITDRGINMIASLELYRKYPYIYEKSKILPKSLISKVYLLDVLKRSNVINYIKYLTHGHSLGILSISYPSNLSWIYILIDDKLLNIIDHWSIIKDVIFKFSHICNEIRIMSNNAVIDSRFNLSYQVKSYEILILKKILKILDNTQLLELYHDFKNLGNSDECYDLGAIIVDVRPELNNEITLKVKRMLVFTE